MTNESRVAAGVPTGAQFAAQSRTEATVALQPLAGSREHYADAVADTADALRGAKKYLPAASYETLRNNTDPVILADADELITRGALAEARTALRSTAWGDPHYQQIVDTEAEATAAWKAATKATMTVRAEQGELLRAQSLNVETRAELQNHRPLPKYPEGLEAAKVGFSTGDDNEIIYVYLTVGDGNDVIEAMAWVDSDGDTNFSYESENTPDGDAYQDFETWGEAVRERVYLDAFSVAEAARTSSNDFIIARATA